MNNKPKMKEVKMVDLFEVKPTKSYKGLKDAEIVDDNGSIRFITTTGYNNGIKGYSSLKPNNKGNVITMSDTSSGDVSFYQSEDFIGRSHVQKLLPKFEGFNRYIAMYIITSFRKSTFGLYNYGNKLNKENINNTLVYLPVTSEGELDFEYMENYIKEIEQKYIQNLRRNLDEKINNLLELTQRTEDDIRDENIQALKEKMRLEYNQKEFKEFKVRDILTVEGTKPLNAGDINFIDDGVNFIGRTKNNNGVQGKIDSSLINFIPNSKGSITISQVGTIVSMYQSEEFYTSQNIVKLNLKNKKMNRYIGLYIITILNKNLMYFQGYTTPKRSDIEEFILTLPVDSNGEIDYDFMEQYVKSLEALHTHTFRVCEEKRIRMVIGLVME